jgi:hypothetical protein
MSGGIYTAAAQGDITVYINKEKVSFADQKPVMIQSRTMVPMRSVFEHPLVQAEVKWNANTKTIVATDRANRTVEFTIGETDYVVRDDKSFEVKKSDVAPVLVNGRTLLPLRALSEALKYEVIWTAEKRRVDLKDNGGYNRNLMLPQSWAQYLTLSDEEKATFT